MELGLTNPDGAVAKPSGNGLVITGLLYEPDATESRFLKTHNTLFSH